MRILAILSLALGFTLGSCAELIETVDGDDIWTNADCDKAGGRWTEFINDAGAKPAFAWCEAK